MGDNADDAHDQMHNDMMDGYRPDLDDGFFEASTARYRKQRHPPMHVMPAAQFIAQADKARQEQGALFAKLRELGWTEEGGLWRSPDGSLTLSA